MQWMENLFLLIRGKYQNFQILMDFTFFFFFYSNVIILFFRVTLVLGYLPQELLGTSMYEYYHHDDIPFLAESHKTVLQSQERISTQVYECKIIFKKK